MKFIYPSFLWALFLIIIPIIIHIVNLRKHRTVYFSNVNLLKQVKKATRKRSRIKELLILASRILLISALVFAFSKPYIPSSNQDLQHQQANNVVGIYIDNSYSMNADGPEGRAIESAREKAYAIVNGSRPDTRFVLLNNRLDEQQNRFYTSSEMMRLIGETDVSHNWTNMSTVQLRFTTLMENFLAETNRSAYFISDFQKYSSDFENFRADTLMGYNFLPVPVNRVANLYLDSCWFESPTHHLNQSEVLSVRIVNSSDVDYYQAPVNFYLNDTLKALTTTDIEAGGEKIVSLQYTNLSPGMQLGRVEISDYPIVYDNTLYLAYNVQLTLKALLIEQQNNATTRYVNAMFSNDEFIQLDVERRDRLQISTLEDYSIIFMNELENISTGLADELNKFVQNGGSLAIIPGYNAGVESYNNLLSMVNGPLFSLADTVEVPLSDIPYNHSLYANVFSDQSQKVELPLVNYRYRFSNVQQYGGGTVLSFADQSLALTLNEHRAGKVYTFAFPLSLGENNFLEHLLFFPTIYNMVFQSANPQQIYYVLGEHQTFDLALTDREEGSSLMFRHEQSGTEIIPTIVNQRGNNVRFALDNTFESGFYTLGGYGVAFNYQLKESEFSYYTGNEIVRFAQAAGIENINLITASSDNLRSRIEEIEKGKQLWKFFILLALLFLAIEAAVIRFWP